MKVMNEHSHDHDDSRHANVPSAPVSRVNSLETLLVEKALVDPRAIRDFRPRLR